MSEESKGCAECGDTTGPHTKCKSCGALLCDPWCHIAGKCGEKCWNGERVRKALGIQEPEGVGGA